MSHMGGGKNETLLKKGPRQARGQQIDCTHRNSWCNGRKVQRGIKVVNPKQRDCFKIKRKKNLAKSPIDQRGKKPQMLACKSNHFFP